MKNLFIADLTLFDGAAAGAGAGAGTAASGEGNAPADAAQGNTEGKDVTVVYGKQPQAEPEAEPAAQNEEKKPLSPEEKKRPTPCSSIPRTSRTCTPRKYSG